MEEAITGDFALIKAWKADKETFYDDCLEGIFFVGFFKELCKTLTRLEILCSVKLLAISMSQCALPEK